MKAFTIEYRFPACSPSASVRCVLMGCGVSCVRQESVAKLEENKEKVTKYKEHEDQKIGGVKVECAELADKCALCPVLVFSFLHFIDAEHEMG